MEKQKEGEQKTKRGRKIKAILRERFSAPRLAYMALFTALAYVVTLLEFPIFPTASFLKLDFANVFFMIEGFIFGPVEAIASIAVKECLSLIDSTTGGVGEIANFLMSLSYVFVSAVAYRFLKGRKWVAVFLVVSILMQVGISLVVNRYINFPLFMGKGAAAAFYKYWQFVLYFNIIKSVSVSVLVFLVYKPLSRFIKATELRFRKRMEKAKKDCEIRLQNPNECDIIQDMAVFVSHGEEETLAFAKEYAKTLRAGDVVCLQGDMGVGKTVFAKGVALGLGITEEVTSPTYAYINGYEDRLFHFDCYRIESEEYAERLGFLEYFDRGGICLVEWSENIKGLLPKTVKRVLITGTGTEREIKY